IPIAEQVLAVVEIEDRVGGSLAELRRQPDAHGALGAKGAALEMEDVELAAVHERRRRWHGDAEHTEKKYSYRATETQRNFDFLCVSVSLQPIHLNGSVVLVAPVSFCSMRAHVSRNDTVRLKTRTPGRESRSAQK